MYQVEYSTTTTRTGFILLSESAITKLDSTLTEEFARLDNLRTESIDAEIRREQNELLDRWASTSSSIDDNERARFLNRAAERVRSHWDISYPKSIKIELPLRNGRTLTGNSLKALAQHAELDNTYPVTLKVSMRCGTVSADINISEATFSGHKLHIHTRPESSELARELSISLTSWADSLQQSTHVKFWARVPAIFFWFAAVFAANVYVSFSKVTNPYTASAHSIIREGVTPQNLPRAVEVMLALQSNYREPPKQPENQNLSWVLLGTLTVCLILLSIKPGKPVIAMGQGRNRYTWWQTYITYAAKLVPAFIAIEIAIPLFHPWLAKFLGLNP
ncbi:hypothetical protein [Sorangium sp. So ce1099]|uniref:hypothetical protein n=1 Tax=Sorangium sp. So ce1099 TaxID=3133331 RepID=UPI003F5E2C76